MASVKITELPSLTGANSASTDVIPVVDVSADITSKMTRAEFFTNIPSITTTGLVGIGTTAPATQLHVSGSTSLIAQFTASISGTTMAVTGFTTGDGLIAVGDIVYGANVSPITKITAQTLGTTGSTGTYTVSVYQTVPSSPSIFTGSPTASRIRIADTDTTTSLGQPTGSIEFFGSDTTAPAAGVGAYLSAISESSSPDTALTFGTRDAALGAVDANERMRIDSSGNVGIGTSTPAENLDIQSSVPTIRLSDTDGSFSRIAHNAATLLLQADEGGVGTGSMNFEVGGPERMRIDSAGRVGIGTTAPAAQLHVSGSTTAIATITSATITGTTMNVASVVADTIAVGDRVYGLGVSPITRILSQTDGTTGGTGNYVVSVNHSPAVSGQMYSSSGAAATIRITDTDPTVLAGQPSGTIEFFVSDTNTPTPGVGAYISAVSEDGSPETSLTFGTRADITNHIDANERMRITSAGNVGIGTSSPAEELHIQATIPTIRLQDSDDSSYTNLVFNAGVFRIDVDPTAVGATNSFFAVDVDGNERMRLTTGGNLGIGTALPVTPLHVVGASITTGVTFQNQPTQTSKSAAVTLTIAELLTGIVQFTGATIGTLTLPTGTAIEGGLPTTFPTNMSFDFSVINTGTAAGAVTITGNTGLTLVGSMVVPITTSGLFRVRKTATNTYTVYRIS